MTQIKNNLEHSKVIKNNIRKIDIIKNLSSQTGFFEFFKKNY